MSDGNDEALFLGVDGGGTKTALCVIDRRGQRLALARASSIYYFGSGIALVEDVLQSAVSAICSDAGVTPEGIQHAFFGLPGYGEASGDVGQLEAIPLRVLGHNRYTCGNDMVCAWAGSLGAEDGINVVSGTGSMAYGERDGRGVRAGGWGERFGDEGSGYWIGARGLAAFSQMSDGRLEAGPLLPVLRESMNLTQDLDAIGLVLNQWKGGRSQVAALSEVVVEAAQQGDDCARMILVDAGVELARLVAAVARRLGFKSGERVCVSYSGGVFNVEAVQASFRESTARLGDSYQVRTPLLDPVTGAAAYAAKCAGLPLDSAAMLRLAATAVPGGP